MRVSFEVDRSTFLVSTASCVVFLLAIHIFLSVMVELDYEVHWLLVQLFDLDDENNLPTWFSSFMLLCTAILLYSLNPQPRDAGHYRLLCLGFLVLSVDEVAGMHETINTAIEMNWAIPGAILVGLLAVWFMPFLMRQAPGLRWMMMLSGALYCSGVVGVELLSADMEEESLAYELAVSVEEGLEMLGVWLFIRTLMLQAPQETASA